MFISYVVLYCWDNKFNVFMLPHFKTTMKQINGNACTWNKYFEIKIQLSEPLWHLILDFPDELKYVAVSCGAFPSVALLCILVSITLFWLILMWLKSENMSVSHYVFFWPLNIWKTSTCYKITIWNKCGKF